MSIFRRVVQHVLISLTSRRDAFYSIYSVGSGFVSCAPSPRLRLRHLAESIWVFSLNRAWLGLKDDESEER